MFAQAKFNAIYNLLVWKCTLIFPPLFRGILCCKRAKEESKICKLCKNAEKKIARFMFHYENTYPKSKKIESCFAI